MIDADVARQWTCQQLLVRFFQLLDAQRYDALVALFDVDGTWERPESVMLGRAEIAATMAERPAGRDTHHVVSNYLVQSDDGAVLMASCLLSTFVVDAATVNLRPRMEEAFTGIFKAHAGMRIENGVARIWHLQLAPAVVFSRPR